MKDDTWEMIYSISYPSLSDQWSIQTKFTSRKIDAPKHKILSVHRIRIQPHF